MTRANALAAMRVAGYHDDRRAWTRLRIEQRVGAAASYRAWDEGKAARAAGVPCACYDCSCSRISRA